MSRKTDESAAPEAVAIIGMAGRFPGARDLDDFWRNLRDGVDCVRDLTEEELLASGVPPEQFRQPGYVRSAGPIADADLFDAGFFGFSPREAEVLDPQQRIFLETAWEALESAGYASESYPGWIGLFAGIAFPTYLLHNLLPNPELVESVGAFPLMLANDRDYFATRVSYKLNLRGTSVNVQTACSTSLVAVHMACQSLLDYQCTVALAGGVRVFTPQLIGYTYAEGGIYSPDGRCRAFDADGRGALFSEGCGVVVLKRLSEAIAEGDTIHAVIRGSATNNDGSNKVGYTAPSVDGQAEVIVMAQAAAGVEPDSISYVETHGSGTSLGDPIEVAALTQAFRSGTDRNGFCALGSLKASVGHMESAAGVGGLIKTVLALAHRQIPPSLHFRTPNPRIDFDSSPFHVNTQLAPWPRRREPRRAGVSSFGMGGTNAHVILEEAPEREPSDPGRPWQLLLLSALTPTALEAATDRLADWIEAHPDVPLADVAFTLQTGRRTFPHRRALVCESIDDAVAALRARDPRRLLGSVQEIAERPVALMFPGLGDHYVDMGLDLYQTEPAFRDEIDRCADLLLPQLDMDIRTVIHPRGTDAAVRQTGALDFKAMLGRSPAVPAADTEASRRLNRTLYAQPALFAVEYALARLLEERGLRPAALVGYSLGEYVAACLAGVLSLEDALALVAGRARLIEELEAGAMLAVPLPEAEARQALTPDLSLAAVNGPSLSVIAGPVAAVEALETKLSADGLACRRLPTTHAFHSSMMEPIRERVVRMAGQVRLSPPEVPYLSNVTGTWITAAEATDPAYWGRHLCQPVRFGQALTELRGDPARVLLEAGPGLGLTTLSLQTAEGDAPLALPTLRPSYERQPDSAFLLGTLAKLWLAGLSPDWAGLSSGETRHRLPLPTYPFERRRYWIDAPGKSTRTGTRQAEEPAPLARHSRPGHLRNLYAPPTNDLERGLCEIWQDILGLDELGIHDSFFELGGHSLVAPKMILKVREVLGVDFPLTHLFEEPTVAGMAKAMETLRTEGHLAALDVDLVAETVLAADVRAEGEAPDPDRIARPKEVFLTGATGFLGAFLLRELLRQTDARIHCLVRSRGAHGGLERIRRKLAEAGIWSEGMARRIAAVPGDLERPRWGLSEPAYDDLAGRVDAVYHCGAWVNFTYPYKALKAANVLSTEEALRFAGRRRTKPVHFISSIAAVSPAGVPGEPVVLEDADYPTTEGLFAGYGPTKWVSERLVTAARERGISGSIYRPGVLAGDSRNGYGNTRDLVWNLIKGSIQLGAAPDQEELMDVAPVDYVAAAIVRLSLSPSELGRTFHFPNPKPASWREVYDAVRAYGYPLRRLSPDDWLDELRTAIRKGADNALAPFAPLLDAAAEGAAEDASTTEQPRELRFDDRNTRAGLEGSGIACPPLDAGLLTLWLDAFVRSGFLRPPAR